MAKDSKSRTNHDKDYHTMIKILASQGFTMVPTEEKKKVVGGRQKTQYFLAEFEARRLEATILLTDKLLIMLGTRMGLRVNEMRAARLGHIESRNVKDGDTEEEILMRFLHVRGKKTHQRKGKGSGEKKDRMVYMDNETYEVIEEITNELNLDATSHLALKPDGKPWSESGIRAHIYKIARDQGIAIKEGGMGTQVSSHDLRRFWATHGLQVREVPPQVILDQGGWGSYQAMQPYQDTPTPDIIYKALKKSGGL